MTGGTEESIKLTAASPGKVLQDPGHSCDSNSSFQQNSLKSTPARQFKANLRVKLTLSKDQDVITNQNSIRL